MAKGRGLWGTFLLVSALLAASSVHGTSMLAQNRGENQGSAVAKGRSPQSSLDKGGSSWGKGSWHDSKAAESDLIGYFSRIPTESRVNADHDGTAPLHQSRLASMPAVDAEKNLLGYFDSLPTSGVNAFHDESLPSHPHTSSLVQYDDATADADITSYYDSVPSHNVNAFHDASSHVRPSNYITEEASKHQLDSYYESLPSHIRVTRSPPPRVYPSPPAKAAEKKEAAAAAVVNPGRDTVSVIQDFAIADDLDARVKGARKAEGYDTNLGATGQLASGIMEETPGGPVETSITRKGSPEAKAEKAEEAEAVEEGREAEARRAVMETEVAAAAKEASFSKEKEERVKEERVKEERVKEEEEHPHEAAALHPAYVGVAWLAKHAKHGSVKNEGAYAERSNKEGAAEVAGRGAKKVAGPAVRAVIEAAESSEFHKAPSYASSLVAAGGSGSKQGAKEEGGSVKLQQQRVRDAHTLHRALVG